MLKLLLTGSTGFIGSNILSEISKDCIVFITSRKKKKIVKIKILLKLILEIMMN
jgi:hypothetical protein